MPHESRLRKSLLNARVNLIFYFLSLALSFFSRKIFLDTLGADFMGLIGALNNLLGFLNLAELGISTAIGYVLYKPLFEHDERKINEIISVFGFIYHRIGFVLSLQHRLDEQGFYRLASLLRREALSDEFHSPTSDYILERFVVLI